MSAAQLIETLAGAGDVSAVLAHIDPNIVRKRAVVQALMLYGTGPSLNVFQRFGLQLQKIDPLWFRGQLISQAFIKEYLERAREHKQVKQLAVPVLSVLYTDALTRGGEHIDHYFELVNVVAKAAGKKILSQVNCINTYYLYGTHWGKRHWDFFNLYCARGQRWKTFLSHAHAHPTPTVDAQHNLLALIARRADFTHVWNKLEHNARAQHAVFHNFSPHFQGGVDELNLPFVQAYVQPHTTPLYFAIDLQKNTVFGWDIDCKLGFDLVQVYLYKGVRFTLNPDLNRFVPTPRFPSFEHQQLATLNKVVQRMECARVFELLQTPLVLRCFLEDVAVDDIARVLKDPRWTTWRDGCGNTLGHLIIGSLCAHFERDHIARVLKLFSSTCPQWLEVFNAVGCRIRDLLDQDDEGVKLYDNLVLRAHIKKNVPRKKTGHRKM